MEQAARHTVNQTKQIKNGKQSVSSQMENNTTRRHEYIRVHPRKVHKGLATVGASREK